MNKICPICNSEYFPEVQMCADCQVPLEWARPDIAPSDPDATVWDRLAPGEFLGELTKDGNEIIEIYLGHLQAAGLTAGVLPLTRYRPFAEFYAGLPHLFGNWFSQRASGQVPVVDGVRGVIQILFVGKAEYEQANAIVQDLFPELHPDNPHGYYREFEALTCPACGAGLLEEWEECPECGLNF